MSMNEVKERLVRIEAKLDQLLKPAPVVPTTQVAPVSYFRKADLWAKVLASSSMAQINPGSGPGPRLDSLYPGVVAQCKAAGVPVHGYVYTDYTKRPIAEVKADIDKHIAWYGVTGIFVDECTTTTTGLAYYTELCAYLRSKGMQIVLNPGTRCDEAYALLADVVMCAEMTAANYKVRTPAAWEAKYPEKAWHCIHTCSAAEMPGIVAKAKAAKVGHLYVTDDVMANPYDTLPTYWDALVAEVA